MNKNYGNTTTRSFKLTSNYVVPSGAYAVVKFTQLFDPFFSKKPLVTKQAYYYAGDTIEYSDFGILLDVKVLVYENDW